jgi:hypothetical protein
MVLAPFWKRKGAFIFSHKIMYHRLFVNLGDFLRALCGIAFYCP